ncbi:MAG: riboflavin synthase [bacterium]
MFTGIIEERGRILSVSKGKVQKIAIESGLEVRSGDSVAIQGICLTVTELTKNGFIVDVMRQTRGVTTLTEWRAGDHLNLERALRIGDRLGGHIMLGHIDEVGKLVRVKSNEYFFKINPENASYIVPKGSIGINGASLTIASGANNILSVSLIPFTLNNTTLGELRTGARVNIEYDYLAKLLQR